MKKILLMYAKKRGIGSRLSKIPYKQISDKKVIEMKL
jgi:hypothetical protein